MSKFLFFISIIAVLLIFVPKTYAGFSEQTKIENNVFKTGCWVTPDSPVLLTPLTDSLTNSSNITFTWNSSTSSCSSAVISYKLEIFSNLSLTNLYGESSWITNNSFTVNSLPEGEYWWKVLAKDQYDNSSVSSVFNLTVDKTSPSVSMNITGSWTKAVDEKITNGGFENGNLNGWTKAGNAEILSTDNISDPLTDINPHDGNYMAKIGNSDSSGNWAWENRLMQSFDSGAKNLSLFYNFFSRDFTNFDDPGFYIRLNGQEIFKLNTLSVNPLDDISGSAKSTGWTVFNYDLSNYANEKLNLAIYAGNTGDQENQSWAYIDKITTYFVAAPSHAQYDLNGSDDNSGINKYEYNIDDSGWLTGSTFSIPSGGEHSVSYRSLDNAGNYSAISTVKIITDTQAPSNISDLSIESEDISSNSAYLTWVAPGNDDVNGQASLYDVRYQKNCDNTNNFNFDTAIKIVKVSSPKQSGETEVLEVLGLNPTTNYCFGLKTADEAPNWSNLSNIITLLTLPGGAVNAGDIVINELMWMGTSVSPEDEYLELRNMTDRTIDLSGFRLTKLEAGSETDMAIDFNGKTIAPNGYFLVAHGNSYVDGQSRLNMTPDIWVSSLDISNTALQIKVYDAEGNLIDTAWDGTAPTEGFYDLVNGHYYSMERTSIPSDGTNGLNWYTTIDSASTADFFDGGVDERGTPKAVNRSENEPLSHMGKITRNVSLIPTPIIIDPQIQITLSEDKKTVSFKITNINNYQKLSYKLTYDTDSGEIQGVIGDAIIDNNNEFTLENIILGTCSSGGTCVYHNGVNNFKIKADLADEDNNILQIEKTAESL